jgi:hypothetical protein
MLIKGQFGRGVAFEAVVVLSSWPSQKPPKKPKQHYKRGKKKAR